MNGMPSIIYFYLLGAVAVIIEVRWFWNRRKAIREAPTKRQKARVERKYRRYNIQLTCVMIVLSVLLALFVDYRRSDIFESQEEDRLLVQDSTEIDEFYEQYRAEKLGEEIDQ